MAKPKWQKSISEVLMHASVEKVYTSPKTGNEYTADTIPKLKLFSTGSVEDLGEGKFRYPVVDNQHHFEYEIKTSNLVEVQLGTLLVFENVRGGMLNNGTGWYAADSVTVEKRNA